MEKTWNEQLREWIGGENKSMAEFSRESEINYSTLKDYCSGKVKNLNGVSLQNRRKLFNYTGLELFRPDESETDNLTEGLEGLRRDMKKLTKSVAKHLPYSEKVKITKSQYQPPVEERVENVRDTVYLLIEGLEHFKDSPEDRKKLTEKLDSEHVGYLVSFLNNLYKSDKMVEWFYKNTSAPKKPKG